jgi:site-specific recombinase XerD
MTDCHISDLQAKLGYTAIIMSLRLLGPAPKPNGPDLISLVIDSVRSAHTKRAYGDAITSFLSWCHTNGETGFNKAAVQRYRCTLEQRNLSPATIKIQLAAVRRLAAEMADNGLLDPLLASVIAAVRGPSRRGVRVGNWLTLQEVEKLLSLPDAATPKGRRDRALLSILLGAGLRRTEAAKLTFDHIQQREGRWVIVDLVGKHDRIRTVPVPGWCKVAIEKWREAAQLDGGRIFRPLNRAGHICGRELSADGVYQIVNRYGAAMGVKIAPHDLRRTFAKLAHKGRAALEQIQFSLGHQSIVTTEAYLGARQDLTDAPCDHLGIHLASAEPP